MVGSAVLDSRPPTVRPRDRNAAMPCDETARRHLDRRRRSGRSRGGTATGDHQRLRAGSQRGPMQCPDRGTAVPQPAHQIAVQISRPGSSAGERDLGQRSAPGEQDGPGSGAGGANRSAVIPIKPCG